MSLKKSAGANHHSAASQGLSARIRFARATIMFSFAISFRSPRVYPEFCVNLLRECKQQKLV